MEKVKKIVVGFLLFNCLSLIVLASTCPPTLQVGKEAACTLTGQWNGYCWYSCPSGAGGFIPIPQ